MNVILIPADGSSRIVATSLANAGGMFHVRESSTIDDACVSLARGEAEAAVLEMDDRRVHWRDDLRRLASASPQAPVILVTKGLAAEYANDAYASGAQECLSAEAFDAMTLHRLIGDARELRRTATRRVMTSSASAGHVTFEPSSDASRESLTGAGDVTANAPSDSMTSAKSVLRRSFPPNADSELRSFIGGGEDAGNPATTEARIRESDQRFKTALENAPIGMALVDADGRWLLVNRALCDMIGYTPDELQQLTFKNITHRDDLDDNLVENRRLFAGEIDCVELEQRYLHKTGRVVWVEITASLVRGDDGRPLYAVAQIQDITQRRRARAASDFLAEAAQVLGSSLESDAILRTMARLAVPRIADCCVIDIEQGAAAPARVVEVVATNAEQEALLREMRERFPVDPMQLNNPVSHVLRTGQPTFLPHVTPDLLGRLAANDEQLRILRRLGPSSLMIVPLSVQSRILGTMTFMATDSGRFFDADDLRLASELATSSALAIDNARLYRAARRAARARDDVLGFVAHDLRNPLAAVTQWASRLETPRTPDEVRRSATAILDAAELMKKLIGDLLDVTRIEAGRFSIDPEFVPVNVLLHLAQQIHEADARAKSVGLSVLPTAGELAYADRQRIHQVLSNLIVNAIKFTPAGGTVTLGAQRSESGLVISVIDTGPGMSPDEVEHVFDRFWQATHSRRGGAGLGMAISRGIVEAHGGRIWVDSAPGRGTTVQFSLPFAEDVNPSAPQSRAQAEDLRHVEPTSADSPRRRFVATPAFAIAAVPMPGAPLLRVVIADDHPVALNGLAATLARESGFEVLRGARSGEEAVELARTLKPDVVVMDLAMPGIGGLEAIRQIAAMPSPPVVLAVSADEHEETAVRALRAGARGFVRKTAQPDELRASVRAAARGDPVPDSALRGLMHSDQQRETERMSMSALSQLSERERDVLALAARGYSAVQSGRKLNLSPKTVETYRSRAMRKLGLESRADLVTFALQSGLLSS